MKPCLDCGAPASATRCRACTRVIENETERLQRTYRWRRFSERLRRKSNLCDICQRPATDDDPITVDHIIPVSLRPDLAFELTNCRLAHLSCNSRVYRQQLAAAGVPPIALTPSQTLDRQQGGYTTRQVGP